MILTGKDVLGRNLSKYLFVHHKFDMNWPGIEPAPPRRLKLTRPASIKVARTAQ